jgi:hypothetical protein
MRFCKNVFTIAIIITSSFFADISFAQTDSKIETIKYHGIL